MRCGFPFKIVPSLRFVPSLCTVQTVDRLELLERFDLLASAASAIGEFKSIVRIRLEMHSLDPR
jgi:hypothetical protein